MDPLSLGLIGAGLYGLWRRYRDKREAAFAVLQRWDQWLEPLDGAPGVPLKALLRYGNDYLALRDALRVTRGDKCVYRSSDDCEGELQIDHNIPVNRGGYNYSPNLQLACRRHNGQKQHKLPLDYRRM